VDVSSHLCIAAALFLESTPCAHWIRSCVFYWLWIACST